MQTMISPKVAFKVKIHTKAKAQMLNTSTLKTSIVFCPWGPSYSHFKVTHLGPDHPTQHPL